MPFVRYQIEALESGYLLSAPQKVILSGPQGLIARHVLPHRELLGEKWTLQPEQIDALLGIPPGQPSWLVFQQRHEDQLQVTKVEKIVGISEHRTELLLAFSPLEVISEAPTFRVRIPAIARKWNEELALESGILDPTGDWKWAKRALNLGSTVLGT